MSTIDPIRTDELVKSMNESCYCVSLDQSALDDALAAELNQQGIADDLLARHGNTFAPYPVFVARRDVDRMAAVVAAMERVVALPGYQERVLRWAPASARHEVAARGVFFGYDFHLGATGPQLIEINTNAGGALLNLQLGRAQRACCPPVRSLVRSPSELGALDLTLVEMFRSEWRAQRGDRSLRTVAIIDERPTEQFLYAEFVLFQVLFRQHGIDAVIVDPSDFRLVDGVLHAQGRVIDLVYNRLTDFGLQLPAQQVLRQAYLDDLAVVTPHPRAHALYADKRNLALLSDPDALAAIGVAEPDRQVLLDAIPRTVLVDPAHADTLWAERKQWFFKPAAGYGSKAAYRGDKLTKRVWEAILQGNYIAQRLVPPSERYIRQADETVPLKVDVRNYAYAGAVQLLSARLYQGQTTNFRTAGGGFAAVFTEPAGACCGPPSSC